MSPHLAFGEISPRQVWRAVGARGFSAATDKFLAELGWREFAYSLLFHFGDLAQRNFRPGVRCLPVVRRRRRASRPGGAAAPAIPSSTPACASSGRTGWMHNRVRMIAASFLTKDLMIDWRVGERWFWDTLVDADPASNAAGWQWVTGSGADAAPYFRIFNPVLQGEKFDPTGDYVRRWVPELAEPAGRDHPSAVDRFAQAANRDLSGAHRRSRRSPRPRAGCLSQPQAICLTGSRERR